MNRMIFLEPLWKLHVGYHLNELRNYPPSGYEFVIHKNVADKTIVSRFSNNSFTPTIYRNLGQFAPLNLIKSYTYSKISQVPDNCELVYCCNHLSFRKRPWIAEMDAIWDPIGPSYRVFRLFRNILEQTISRQYCRAILTFSEFSKQILLSTLKSEEARNKVSLLPRAVHSKSIMANNTDNDYFHLLFIGSANLAGEFEMRGGKEVLEAFRILSHNNSRVHLTVRSDIPRHIVEEYHEIFLLPNFTWFRGWLDREKIEALFLSSNLLLLPGHYDNWLVVLEAMSYGLPVITTDIYSNRERIDDGENGFLVKPSCHVPYYLDGFPLFTFDKSFQKAIRKVDKNVVNDIVEKINILMEDRALLSRVSKEAKYEVDQGKFSIENRNNILKKVFDDAID